MTKRLDPTVKQNTEYCIPLWLRDQQIKSAIERGLPTVIAGEKTDDPIALVSYGPSLNDTWEKVRDFKTIMTCSGSHRFLIDRGIIPTFHVEVDPREHKVALLGEPHPDVIYLVASTCHPKYFDHLLNAGAKVRVWHVFANEEDAIRTLPHGEWALTGGCSVGLRCMTIARFFGFTNQHIFGMDGSEGPTGKHAAAHPNQQKGHAIAEVRGVEYRTTAAFLEAARGTFHELNQMPDVNAVFYGDGLVQAMAKDYVRVPAGAGKAIVGYAKPALISAEYADLNRKLHKENLAYGVGGAKHAPMVRKLMGIVPNATVLDYGCGKGLLSKELRVPIWEYDPAVPGKEESPPAADIVVCTDVLEHIEPDHLDAVLNDLRRVTKRIGYFTIHTGAAKKTLPDGRNTHLIQQKWDWWKEKLEPLFTIGKKWDAGPELVLVVGPKAAA